MGEEAFNVSALFTFIKVMKSIFPFGRRRFSERRRMSVLAGVLSVCAAVAVLLTGCSTKKNTPASRNWHAFTTRYNVYFNGSEHYKETLDAMEKSYEDDYTQFVLTHPAEAKANQKLPQPTGDFNRTIEKMQKAIQLHSISKKPAKKSGSAKEKEFRARTEFNPFLHNAWMMMAKSQFLNGDFLGASSTFMYISKHFTWLPAVVTEAKLWQARCYCAMDWDYEADNILSKIKEKELTSKSLRNLYNETLGDYYVRTKEFAKALPYLKDAAAAASGTQKNRLWFLAGQAARASGNNREAYEAFKKAASGLATPYRTKFNARIKQSEVFTGKDISGEVRALRSLARYQRNSEFLDQIYYAIGNLYLSRGDTAEAKKNYITAMEKSTRNGIDKALVGVALGNIYFDERDYIKAQPCYSEAIPQLAETFPNYKTLKKRSDVLDELVIYAGNVELQDSLLRLSKLPEEEQRKVCQRLVDELIRQEKEAEEAARREEALAMADANSPMNANAPSTPTFNMNNDKSWYFYNTMTKNQGKTEFQRKWGSRKLEDDWRRRNKTSFSFDDPAETENDAEGTTANDSIPEEEKAALEAASDPHNVEFYLSQIPKTEEEIETANDVIQEGLYNMGVILKDKLEDFPAARHEFLELEDRYPDNVYRLDVYYNLYLMAVRSDDRAEAEKWKRLIIENFPDSPYGKAMLDPDYFTNLRTMHVRQETMYEEAYNAYLDNKNGQVHKLVKEMETTYPLSPILPKFVFIDALSYLTEKDYGKFKERLTELLQKWPDTDMTDMAGSIVRGLNAGRTPNAGSANTRGMIWDLRLSDSETPLAADGQPAAFERDPDKPQYLVLAFDRDSISSNMLLYEVARFNFSSFVVQDFDLEQMSFGNIGLLIIKGFENLRQLEHYRSVMVSKDFELPEGVRPVMISKANFELLLREGRSFEEYFRFEADEAAAEAEAKVLEGIEEEDPEALDAESGELRQEGTATEEGEVGEEEVNPEAPQAVKTEEETSEETEEETPVEAEEGDTL